MVSEPFDDEKQKPVKKTPAELSPRRENLCEEPLYPMMGRCGSLPMGKSGR